MSFFENRSDGSMSKYCWGIEYIYKRASVRALRNADRVGHDSLVVITIIMDLGFLRQSRSDEEVLQLNKGSERSDWTTTRRNGERRSEMIFPPINCPSRSCYRLQ